MRYIKAEDVLPQELLEAVWNYVDGVTLYIPRKPENRRSWGCGTTYRRELEERNQSICREWETGISVAQLARKYHLTEKSISRILRNP